MDQLLIKRGFTFSEGVIKPTNCQVIWFLACLWGFNGYICVVPWLHTLYLLSYVILNLKLWKISDVWWGDL